MVVRRVILVFLTLVFVGMGLFSHRMWRLWLLKDVRNSELAEGNWVFTENMHFYNLSINRVNIYSKKLPSQTLYFGDLQLNVVPLFTGFGRQPTAADILIFTNDTMLLRFACFLAVKEEHHDLANAIISLIGKNVSWVGESDPYIPFIISACKALLDGDMTFHELVIKEADSYATYMKIYANMH